MKLVYKVSALVLLVCTGLIACDSTKENMNRIVRLHNIKTGTMDTVFPPSKPFSAYIFFSPTCPICISNIGEISSLSRYQDSVELNLIFPRFSIEDSIKLLSSFYAKHDFIFFYEDRNTRLTSLLNATVTPEAILTDCKGQIIYRGALNDYYRSVGVHGNKIEKHYLVDAIEQALAKKSVQRPYVEPIGCFIER